MSNLDYINEGLTQAFRAGDAKALRDWIAAYGQEREIIGARNALEQFGPTIEGDALMRAAFNPSAN